MRGGGTKATRRSRSWRGDWRGYALDALQDRMGALEASLLLGGAWALWYVPLLFVPGFYDGSVSAALLFVIVILIDSVLFTWIHNHTHGSVLAAILFHFVIDASGKLAQDSDATRWLAAPVTGAIAVAVIVYSGPANLSRE